MPKLCIQSFHVAGVSHAKPDLSLLAVGDEVGLIAEPHNPFDPNAIKIISPNGVKLGYVPAASTFAVWDANANGLTPTAFIAAPVNETKHKEILVHVFVEVAKIL